MTNRWCLFSILLLCLMLIQPSIVSAAEPDSPADLARERIAAEFSRLDSALRQTTEKLGTVGLKGEPARKALRGLCAAFPYAVDCTAVDAHGIMSPWSRKNTSMWKERTSASSRKSCRY